MNKIEMYENEKWVNFVTTDNPYIIRKCIIEEGSTDISAALEMTLHRILDAGGTDADILEILGAYIPDELEYNEMYDNQYICIDLSYVIAGNIMCWDIKTEKED